MFAVSGKVNIEEEVGDFEDHEKGKAEDQMSFKIMRNMYGHHRI